MAENIVVQSKVRELVKETEEGFRISDDFLASLNVEVEQVIKSAVARAKANGRKTLQPHDI